MSTSKTLADSRSELDNAPDRRFHTSLPLYVLLEKRPRPDAPNWIQVGCLNRGGVTGMMVYLSPIDAMIDLFSRNRKGGKYRIYPFDAIDPSVFINEHDGWLTVFLVHSFAANKNRILLNEGMEPLSLSHPVHFQVGAEVLNHFHLQFNELVIDWLEKIQTDAKMPDYNRVMQSLSTISNAELISHARKAVECAGNQYFGREEVTHCGLYDPIEQKWQFAPYPELKTKAYLS